MKPFNTLNLQIGDAIVVKPGVLCPDRPELSLAGWQGWIVEFYPEHSTIGFEWDSLTLRSISKDYIRESLIAGLGWETMGLDSEDVLPITPRDKPEDRKAVYEEISRYHEWDYLAEFNPGINDLLGPLGEADESTYLDAWEGHLREVLKFPFEVRLEEKLVRGPVNVGDNVTIIGISNEENRFGLIANVRQRNNSHALPLCQLEATDYNSPNYQPLNDYVVWFANR